MKKQILVIEDEPAVRLPLVGILAGEFPEYTVEGVESAEEAQRLIPNEEGSDRVTCLVIADEFLGKGKLRGSEFLAYMRQNYPGIRRIMFEAKAGPQDISRAVNNGGIDKYIHKGMFDNNPEVLFTAIREALSEREGDLHDVMLEMLQEADLDDTAILMAGPEKLETGDLMRDIMHQTDRGRGYVESVKKLFCNFFLHPEVFMEEVERLGKEWKEREHGQK